MTKSNLIASKTFRPNSSRRYHPTRSKSRSIWRWRIWKRQTLCKAHNSRKSHLITSVSLPQWKKLKTSSCLLKKRRPQSCWEMSLLSSKVCSRRSRTIVILSKHTRWLSMSFSRIRMKALMLIRVQSTKRTKMTSRSKLYTCRADEQQSWLPNSPRTAVIRVKTLQEKI